MAVTLVDTPTGEAASGTRPWSPRTWATRRASPLPPS